jgi:hypothetical protein
MNRGCPLMTADDRCVGHVGGTAGKGDLAQSLPAMLTSSSGG